MWRVSWKGFESFEWRDEGLSNALFEAARVLSASGNRIGQQADGQRIGVRAIVIEDGPIVGGQQITLRIGARRLHQGRHFIVRNPVVSRYDAFCPPFAN